MEAITIKNISKKFRHSAPTTLKGYILRDLWKGGRSPESFLALKNLSLSIKKGTTFGIIGKNGSGKSTLLKIIGRILQPDAGSVKVNGTISALIELGAGFHHEFSGRENIYINGMLLGLTKKEIQKKIDEIIEFAELRDFIDEPVRTYSSGMYSRLGFSVAVNVDPDILLIDEVFAVGDESFVQKCKGKMDEFKRRGKTILFVTHDLSTIERWCDESVWIHNGAIMTTGNPIMVADTYRQGIFESEENKLTKHKEDIQEQLQSADTCDNEKQDIIKENKDAVKGKRWGNREAEITSVMFLDNEGKERYIYHTGEGLTIYIQYKAHKPIEKPVCGIAIIRNDGVLCYGTNTGVENIKINEFRGTGDLTITIKNFNLIEGQYYIDVAIHTKEGIAYDYHSQLYQIAVKSGKKDVGVFRPEYEWKFSGGFLISTQGDETKI